MYMCVYIYIYIIYVYPPLNDGLHALLVFIDSQFIALKFMLRPLNG